MQRHNADDAHENRARHEENHAKRECCSTRSNAFLTPRSWGSRGTSKASRAREVFLAWRARKIHSPRLFALTWSQNQKPTEVRKNKSTARQQQKHSQNTVQQPHYPYSCPALTSLLFALYIMLARDKTAHLLHWDSFVNTGWPGNKFQAE